MTGLLLAIFLGWLGVYRFYKKQWLLGVVYLFTGGIAGIGWIIDIVIAYKEYKKSKTPLNIDCEIKGGFAECKKNPSVKRKDVIVNVPEGSPLNIEIDYYNGSPYYLVCAPNGFDIGAVPSEITSMIKYDHSGASLSAILINKQDIEHAMMRLTIQG